MCKFHRRFPKCFLLIYSRILDFGGPRVVGLDNLINLMNHFHAKFAGQWRQIFQGK